MSQLRRVDLNSTSKQKQRLDSKAGAGNWIQALKSADLIRCSVCLTDSRCLCVCVSVRTRRSLAHRYSPDGSVLAAGTHGCVVALLDAADYSIKGARCFVARYNVLFLSVPC